MATGLVLLMVALASLWLVQRYQSRRSVADCTARLRGIYHAMQQYAQHSERLPDELLGLPEVRSAICPETHEAYLYLAGRVRWADIQPTSILVLDSVAGHEDKGLVLYGDGEVKPVTQGRINAIIRLSEFRPAMAIGRSTSAPATAPADGPANGD